MSTPRALSFVCRGCALFGILHLPAPDYPAVSPLKGILIVTGGPQTRIGSHRQFILLARYLAALGYPVLRFDYRGMGDSEGAQQEYTGIGDDLACAIDQFFRTVPGMGRLVLWGLCDGATAAAMHAATDPRVSGLILLNPWVHTDAGHARATLRHYYWHRLRQAEFWRKVMRGQFAPATAWRSLRKMADASAQDITGARRDFAYGNDSAPLQLQRGLFAFRGPVLVILSGNDIGAREFAALQRSTPAWRAWGDHALNRLADIAQATHTFSRACWRDSAAQLCADWLASW